jgi:hypothetical protein
MNILQSRVNNIIDNHIISPTIDNILYNSDSSDNIKNNFSAKNNLNKKNNDFIEINNTINASSIANTSKSNGGNVIKLIIILFLLYIIISSNIFTRTILSIFGKRCIKNGSATCFGVIIQGILLVCFYMLFAYLVNKGAI